jgi:hypothetical protein
VLDALPMPPERRDPVKSGGFSKEAVADGLPGGCTCGRVRYRLREDPIAFYACHCTECQRESGSAFGLSMIVRREALDHERGEVTHIEVPLESGGTKQSVRCAHCGTRLWSEPPKIPQLRILRPGTLDDPRAYEPYGNMWTRSAQPWAGFAPGPRYEEDPPDALAMVRAWQGRKG